MRSSLVVSGGIITATGVALFAALDGDAWLALVAGGFVVMISGFLLDEATTERVEPPQGYRFCPFCTTPVMVGEERCSHCNGLQPEKVVARPTTAPATQPND